MEDASILRTPSSVKDVTAVPLITWTRCDALKVVAKCSNVVVDTKFQHNEIIACLRLISTHGQVDYSVCAKVLDNQPVLDIFSIFFDLGS